MQSVVLIVGMTEPRGTEVFHVKHRAHGCHLGRETLPWACPAVYPRYDIGFGQRSWMLGRTTHMLDVRESRFIHYALARVAILVT